MDLRTQKVYDALSVALRRLLEEKDFDKVTVSELCECARVRRATFYRHFSDKYDFLQYLLGRLRDEILADAREQSSFDDPQDYLRALVDGGLKFTEKNEKLLISVRESGMARQMLLSLTERAVREDNSPFPFDDELRVQFMIGGLNQCAEWWLDNMASHPRSEMQEKLYAIVEAYTKSVG